MLTSHVLCSKSSFSQSWQCWHQKISLRKNATVIRLLYHSAVESCGKLEVFTNSQQYKNTNIMKNLECMHGDIWVKSHWR